MSAARRLDLPRPDCTWQRQYPRLYGSDQRLIVPAPAYLPKRRRGEPLILPFVRPRMAIAHALTDTTQNIASNGATTTVTLPTGVTSSHTLVCVFASNATDPTTATTTAAPGGWQRAGPAGGVTSDDATDNCYVTGFVAKDASAATTVFTNTGTGNAQSWVIAAFTGVDQTTPIDVAGTGDKVNGSATATLASITIVTANAWDIVVCSDWLSGVFTITGFTVSPSSVAGCASALCYNTTPKATGATGTATLNDNASATGQILVALRFALRPAGAAGTVPNRIIEVNQSITTAVY